MDTLYYVLLYTQMQPKGNKNPLFHLREHSREHHAGGDTCIVRDLVHILSVGTLWGPNQQHNIKTSFDPFMSLL